MAFPLLLIFGLVGSIAGTLLTPPESDDVLCEFYRTVKPWGAWGPICDKVIALDPDFAPNRAFYRDMFNVAIGIVLQIGLVVMPIYLVIQQWWSMLTAFGVIVVTSWILKKNWLDKLPD